MFLQGIEHPPEDYRPMIDCRSRSAFLISCWLLFEICSPSAALSASSAELISNFRMSQGLGRVTMDPALNRIAQEQATAMAARNVLDHEAAGSFSSRVASLGPRHVAENVAYGHDSFTKTLDQWIKSSGHRKNLLLQGASRVGVASAKSPTTGRTYWTLVIAGGYDQPKRAASKAVAKVKSRGPAPQACRLSIMGLCL